MRWFKHMTDSADDEKLAALLAQHGPEGYGLWWMVVELVAKQIPKDGNVPTVTYPLSAWLRFTGIYHHKKFKILVQSMHNLSLISAQSPSNLCNISVLSAKDLLTISIPNILKFRDEYSKKSGQNPESVRSKKEKQIQKQMEIEKKNKQPPLRTVSELSALYQQCAGVNQVNSCQVVVFQDLLKRFPWEVIEETFLAGAANQEVSAAGFLNWCRKRMERKRDDPDEQSTSDFLDSLPGGEA